MAENGKEKKIKRTRSRREMRRLPPFFFSPDLATAILLLLR